jgi:hypothetical protein
VHFCGSAKKCSYADVCYADVTSVKSGVESSIQYLLQKRDKDPFADTGVRMLWEAAAGRQAGRGLLLHDAGQAA